MATEDPAPELRADHLMAVDRFFKLFGHSRLTDSGIVEAIIPLMTQAYPAYSADQRERRDRLVQTWSANYSSFSAAGTVLDRETGGRAAERRRKVRLALSVASFAVANPLSAISEIDRRMLVARTLSLLESLQVKRTHQYMRSAVQVYFAAAIDQAAMTQGVERQYWLDQGTGIVNLMENTHLLHPSESGRLRSELKHPERSGELPAGARLGKFVRRII